MFKFMNLDRFGPFGGFREGEDNTGGQGGANGNNNGGDNGSSFVDFWKDEEPGGTQTGGSNTDPTKTTEPQNPQDVMKQHLDSLNLTEGVNLSNIIDEQGNLSQENLLGAIDQVAKKAYLAAMQNANNMMKSQLEKVRQEAVDQAGANMTSQSMIKQMNTELPFTKDERFAPLANSVLTRLVAKGKSVEDAVQSVNNYFKELATEIGPSDGNGNINNSRGKTPDPMDFADVFGTPQD